MPSVQFSDERNLDIRCTHIRGHILDTQDLDKFSTSMPLGPLQLPGDLQAISVAQKMFKCAACR